ncbi:MAG TPA: hypothetical protein VFD97_09240 [Acidimicrobiia bacterium]|nr:hypothetical protein [Acidimicrobiia bacterium]
MKIAAIIGGALGALGAIVGGVWMLQDHLIYSPGPDPGHPPEPWEEISVSTDDGLILTNWYRIDSGATGRSLIVVFPGNAGNRADRLPLGNALAEAGYGVILSEYRGYGAIRDHRAKNGSSPTRSSCFARHANNATPQGASCISESRSRLRSQSRLPQKTRPMLSSSGHRLRHSPMWAVSTTRGSPSIRSAPSMVSEVVAFITQSMSG